ncbi:MAG: Methyltransferase type 11 [Candidatus Magasanikbacteria bacterium GW2011_GWD2_43_18]|uniref:Methyltransferase type 11 n=1 Tax=Candidatus Magasanikbacteria bacterium GW2011_GWE2_42_7 TaxID=1619052 RepID=A0A0G1BI39_9BACT|nr:MAG: Methyltransferase type 11 [Candidatus Magasanikbacteria bacterium GW2011_GWC2_42_27]KKS72874.1 MAG: Methyltransferase type 11 [Candidatus Magasanikbacteria bacterium GW2011_GWE2_42_7]KKT05233.1 MAG: Methyltransferase type 11 [Candidatus Magasanikbacteria bacterium GW2011_GWD2_43_18]KKT26145.1 MAG: Methyltransferase type 11 [Candidatus Magasanikbacteria bacterium GW2011_GWA2_43_9]HBB37570.1 SAM-dependent methyltransferase [Candidatus Magasanikbacteria bacterium]
MTFSLDYIAYRVSAWNRRRKWQRYTTLFPPMKGETVLDVGCSDIEYSETDNFLEKKYPHQSQITALGIDTPKAFPKTYPEVTCVQYDGGIFPFTNEQFDICWSNAVLEHVGDEAAQVLFLKEAYRVAKKGFITTPNKFFPIEVHTRVPLLHFVLPKKMFDAFLRLIGKQWATGSYMRLLSERDLRSILDKAGIKTYRLFKNRMLGWTLDFVIVFDKEQDI